MTVGYVNDVNAYHVIVSFMRPENPDVVPIDGRMTSFSFLPLMSWIVTTSCAFCSQRTRNPPAIMLAASIFAVPHLHEQIRPVLGDAGAEAPRLVVLVLEDELVFVLRVAEAVVVDLLEVVGLLEVLALLRLRVARVEEAFVVLRPRGAG